MCLYYCRLLFYQSCWYYIVRFFFTLIGIEQPATVFFRLCAIPFAETGIRTRDLCLLGPDPNNRANERGRLKICKSYGLLHIPNPNYVQYQYNRFFFNYVGTSTSTYFSHLYSCAESCKLHVRPRDRTRDLGISDPGRNH